MKRRKALKGMVLFALGTQIVYSCKDKYEAIKSLPLTNLPLNDMDISMIDELSNRILPIQELDALKDHTTLPFILTMANDCLSPEERESFINGCNNFDSYVKDKKGKSLDALSEDEFKSLIDIMTTEEDKENPNPQHFFANYVRSKNIQYLTSSEHFLTTYREYEMAPGFYNGCVPLS